MAPGLRDPADPEAPEAPPPEEERPTPTTPAPAPTLPGYRPPTSPAGRGPLGKTAPRTRPKGDDKTWETWWELHRVEFLPMRWAGEVVTPEEGTWIERGPHHLGAAVIRDQVWPVLLEASAHPKGRVREAALIALARVAADDAQKSEARAILLRALEGRDHLLARAAALGLYHASGPGTLVPLSRTAFETRAQDDVRAFAALTLTRLGHDVGPGILCQLIDTADRRNRIAGPAIMALGHATGSHEATSIAVLEALAFKGVKHVPEVHRALALESLGRLGSRDARIGFLRKGLADADVLVRRTAAIGLGTLDYRTPSERRMAEIRAPLQRYVGVALSKEDEARLDVLAAQVPAERKAMLRTVKPVIRDLAHALTRDRDSFTRAMAAVSLGRMHAQYPYRLIGSLLRDELKRDRRGLREYALLAMAIAGLDATLAQAREFLGDPDPSTRGAACVALGLLGRPERVPAPSEATRTACAKLLQERLVADPHPFIRGYAALAGGIVGRPGARPGILQLLRATRTPEARAYALLGLALLGGEEASAELGRILASRRDMRDPILATHAIYALGLTKDRRHLGTLLEVAAQEGEPWVRAAALVAIAYLCVAEPVPYRHTWIRGHDYTLGQPDLLVWFRKL